MKENKHFFTHIITKEETGQPVRAVLYDGMALSTRKIRALKKTPDGILLDGRPVTVRGIVTAGQRLQVQMDDGVTDNMATRKVVAAQHAADEIASRGYGSQTKELPRILYEDADLLFVNKPSGMVCHPSKGHSGDSLYDQICVYYGRTGQTAGVHLFGRLDKDTSGIVGIAKNKMTADRMHRQRTAGTFYKEYLALVQGMPPEPSGTVSLPMEEDRSAGYLKMRAGIGSAAKPAVTHYTVIRDQNQPVLCDEDSSPTEKRPWTLCRVSIETGRTHQIRFHMAAIGCPLAGDTLYGQSPSLLRRRKGLPDGKPPGEEQCAAKYTTQYMKQPSGESEAPQIRRAALHASHVHFIHPFTGKEINLHAPLPEDMRRLIENGTSRKHTDTA